VHIIIDVKKSLTEELRSRLQEYIGAYRDRFNRCAVLYSGGLDSSVVAALASTVMSTTAYAVGTEGSHDLKAASEGAAELDIPLVKITASSAEVIEACRLLHDIFSASLDRKPDRLELSIYSPMTWAMMHVREELVFTGQGADEEFGGYSRYASMSAHERKEAMTCDVSKLITSGIDRDRAIAMKFGKTLGTPYLSDDVIRLSSNLEDRDKFLDGQNKAILRRLALEMGLSSSGSAKKAMQYGSGFERIIAKQKNSLERT